MCSNGGVGCGVGGGSGDVGGGSGGAGCGNGGGGYDDDDKARSWSIICFLRVFCLKKSCGRDIQTNGPINPLA